MTGFRPFTLGLVLAATNSLPAGAQWKVHSSTDRLMARQANYATVGARAVDQGIPATLEINCVTGRPGLGVQLGTALTRGQIALTYRIGDNPPKPSIREVSADPFRIALFLPPQNLGGARIMRVELHPTGSPALFYEFDVQGWQDAAKAVRCR